MEKEGFSKGQKKSRGKKEGREEEGYIGTEAGARRHTSKNTTAAISCVYCTGRGPSPSPPSFFYSIGDEWWWPWAALAQRLLSRLPTNIYFQRRARAAPKKTQRRAIAAEATAIWTLLDPRYTHTHELLIRKRGARSQSPRTKTRTNVQRGSSSIPFLLFRGLFALYTTKKGRGRGEKRREGEGAGFLLEIASSPIFLVPYSFSSGWRRRALVQNGWTAAAAR